MEKSDEELMELYQKGDFMAFETLYIRHSPRIYEFLKKKTSTDIAHDLMQEVFAKLHKSRKTYNPQYPFLPWIFTVVRNTLTDFYKKNESKMVLSSSSIENHNIEALLATQENLMQDNKIGQDISHILMALPEQQRQVIELRYLQEWSFEQIANELQTSPENIRKIVSRSLKKMRSLILKKEESL